MMFPSGRDRAYSSKVCETVVSHPSFSQQITFVLPTIPAYFLVGSLAVVHGLYAKYFGLSLGAIAVVLLVTRLFDAVSDPLIGYCSDRYHTRKGTRKPFVMAGGVLLIIGSYFLFSPVSNSVTATYFLVWFLAWYCAFSFFEIPQLSWGAELVTDSHTRTRLYGLRNLGANTGLILFYLVPLSPVFVSSAYTPDVMLWIVVIAAALMLPALWLCGRFTPDGKGLINKPEPEKELVKHVSDNPLSSSFSDMASLVSEVVSNKPLLIFLVTFLLSGIGSGMHFALQFILIDMYLGLGDDFAKVSLTGLCVGSAVLLVCIKLAHYLNKKLAWAFGVTIYILGIMFFSTFQAGVVTGSDLILVTVLIYSGASVINLIVPSLLADIIDYGAWKYKTDRTATYFSLLMFSVKTTAAVGSALALGIAGYYGFDAAATVHTPEQIHGLKLAAFLIPIPILLLTLVAIYCIPINAYRHQIIRRRLDRKAEIAASGSATATNTPTTEQALAFSK